MTTVPFMHVLFASVMGRPKNNLAVVVLATPSIVWTNITSICAWSFYLAISHTNSPDEGRFGEVVLIKLIFSSVLTEAW